MHNFKVFFSLVKCDLLQLFGFNKMLHSGKSGTKVKFVLAVIGLAFLGVFVAAMSALYTFLFAAALTESGSDIPVYNVLGVFILLYIIVALLFSLTSANGTVFGGKDYDTLMSLPINPVFVALAKATYVYIFLFIMALVIVFPSATVCAIFSKSGAISPLTILSCMISLPFLPLGAGLFIGSGIAILMAKVKRKNLLKTIFSFIGMAVYFYFVFGLDLDFDDSAAVSAGIGNLVKMIAPACFMAKGFMSFGLEWLVAFLLPIAVSALYFRFVSANYKKINTLILTKRTNGNFKMSGQKQNSLFKCLFVREVKQWAACSGAVLNHLIGPLLSLALVIYVVASGSVTKVLENFTGEDIGVSVGDVLFYCRGILPLIPVFFVSVGIYTCCSVSLEGKSVWLIKSLPVKYSDFLKPKLALGLLISLPITLIVEILFGITFSASAPEIIFSVLLVTLYCLSANLFGLYINLKHPFLDWKNPAEAIKRGTATAICTLLGMFMIIPLGIIAGVCMAFLHNYYIAWGLIFGLFALFAVLMLWLFKRNGSKLYVKL